MRIELSLFVQVTHDLLHGETFFLIKIHVGAEVDLGLEVADVVVALAAHGAQAELDVIHTIARAEGIAALRIAVFAEEVAALHAQRTRHAGERKRGGGEVEQADDLFIHRTGLEAFGCRIILGPLDNHRHVQAGVVHPMDAAMIHAAVVAKDDDDRVVEQLFLFQFLQHDAHAAVHVGYGIQIPRPFLVGGFVLGKIGRRHDRFRLGILHVLLFAPPLDALGAVRAKIINIVLRFRRVHLQEKRPALFDFVPVGALKDFAFIDKIQIQLARADHLLADFLDGTGEITGILQPMRQRPHAFRQLKTVIAMIGEVMQIHRGLIHPRHERRPARRAHRRCGKHPRVPHPLRG